MLKKKTKLCKEINTNIGIVTQDDLHFEEQTQNKNSLKAYSNLTSKNGITLIALIITIILMLILVSVSVSISINGGLFSTAQHAKKETEITQIKKMVEQDIVSKQVENDGKISNEDLRIILEKYFDDVPNPLPDDLSTLELTTNSEYGKQKIIIGEIYNGGLMQTAESLNVSNYGEYVNYNIDIDGDGITSDDWRIFYTDNEHIFLISADYVPNSNPNLIEAVKKSSMKNTEVNGVRKYYCDIWEESNLPTYNCNIEGSEECSFPSLFEFTGYDINAHKDNPNSKCVASLLCTKNWESFIAYGAEYAIGGPTIEMWINSWNQHDGNYIKLYCNNTDNNGYFVGNTDKPNSTNINMQYVSGQPETKEGYYDELYFPHRISYMEDKNNNQAYTCHTYWLASPAANYSGESLILATYNGSLIASWQAFNDENEQTKGYSYVSAALRPVVCLKAEVELIKHEGNTYYDIK